jgi:hypothetical protein
VGGVLDGGRYPFSDTITTIVAQLARVERGLVVVALVVASYIVAKYVRRRLFLRALRIARIAPETLKSRLDAGEAITIVDLRTRLEVEATPFAIPGSRWMSIDELDQHQWEFLRSRELVLYCS